ncbi:importin beta-2 subunit family protein [Striga asiatica]|uniref:Importin beta-2 subunit family protein n=1 Tax=Striga asiatica TaxID=4170 RepID=A0A5A7PHX6_STRAF|nr:importin beta-2 subunit family protein [Striga asiatica]
MDQDQQWLINCLNASLDPSQQTRTFAETSLQQASLQPVRDIELILRYLLNICKGYGVALARIAAHRELQFGLRQISLMMLLAIVRLTRIHLAAVLLKQFIRKHWNEDEEGFEHPVVESNEKAAVKGLLLSLLDDPSKKICTAVSVAVSAIAQYDWPEDWPELVPFLLNLINDQSKLNAVHGALRCLSLLSSDMDDKMVPQLVPVLFPCLHAIMSSPQIYDKSLRSKALSVIYNCTSMIGAMSGVYKTETTALMLPLLQPWMDHFSSILKHPVPSEDPDDWSIRMETVDFYQFILPAVQVLKCLNQFIQNFPTITETHFAVSHSGGISVILGPLWQTLVSSLGVYERSVIEGVEDSYDGRYDSDGAEKSLESFVIQLFEFLLTVIGSPRFMKVVMNNLKELVYYTIGFLQMTEQQVHTWSLDPNQYVADEDDNTYSCRVSGALLLEEVISNCGTEGINAVIDSVKSRISESQQAKDTGSPGWWRLREAALYALASVAEQLLEVEVSGSTVGPMLGQILTDDMATGVHDYPFLCARLFSSVARFSSMMDNQVTEQFLYAAIKTVGMDVPPPVKVGACRALSQLLPDATTGIVQQFAFDLFSSLIDLLKNASDETMHLILETLQAAVAAGHEVAASIEPVLSPIMLNMWASHVSDPFISIDVLEVLEAIKKAPGCIHPLVSRVIPYIGPILSSPQQQPDGLVAGSLDLVTMLIKNAPVDVVKALFQVSFDPVVRIVLQSTDHSEMQNATQCLAALVSVGKQDMLSWSGDPGFTMRSLLDVASRLLDPELESSGSLFVGSYILQLILHLPSQMAQQIRDLVTALIRRMQSSWIAGLKCSLLLIFARLVHMSVPHVEQFVDMLVSIPAKGEIQGAYQIKVTTTALALLLLTRHVELGNINVKGQLIKSYTGITTRSKARRIPDQWTVVPLPAKILAILADTLIEIQEQTLIEIQDQVDGDNEDSDWEEVENEDGDFLYSSANSASHGRPTYEYLDAMAKAFNEDQEDDYEDDLLSGVDPLNEMNLVNVLFESLAKFSEGDRPYFEHLFQSLTKPQQKAIELVLRRRAMILYQQQKENKVQYNSAQSRLKMEVQQLPIMKDEAFPSIDKTKKPGLVSISQAKKPTLNKRRDWGELPNKFCSFTLKEKVFLCLKVLSTQLAPLIHLDSSSTDIAKDWKDVVDPFPHKVL